MSIHIGHAEYSNHLASPGPIPPHDLMCAEFQRLSLHLDLRSVEKSKTPPSKKAKYDSRLPGLQLDIDHCISMEKDNPKAPKEITGRMLHTLPCLTGQYFDLSIYATSGSHISFSDHFDLLNNEVMKSQSSPSSSFSLSQSSNSSVGTLSPPNPKQGAPEPPNINDIGCILARTKLSSICELAEHSLRVVIGGTQRLAPGIVARIPHLNPTLSSLAPSTWSPGFSEV